MALTKTPVCDFGKKAEDFKLKSIENKIITLNDVKGDKATLIMFICNHCPFVIHILDELISISEQYKDEISFIAISSNDVINYPQDAPSLMKKLAFEKKFSFPYLYDETQEVAKKYNAACTPDFFLYNNDRELVYRGQLDDSRPGNNIPVTGNDLRTAIVSLIQGNKQSINQKPSIGCNIKWK